MKSFDDDLKILLLVVRTDFIQVVHGGTARSWRLVCAVLETLGEKVGRN